MFAIKGDEDDGEEAEGKIDESDDVDGGTGVIDKEDIVGGNWEVKGNGDDGVVVDEGDVGNVGNSGEVENVEDGTGSGDGGEGAGVVTRGALGVVPRVGVEGGGAGGSSSISKLRPIGC